MMTGRCFDDSCDRPEGHSGSHGYSPHPDLVFGPHGGGEGDLLPSFPSGLICPDCGRGSEMTARRYVNGGGELVCPCGKDITVGQDHVMSFGQFTLWPKGMKESSPRFREYIIWRCRQRDLRNKALLLFKLIDEDELQRRLAETQQAFDCWERAHPVQHPDGRPPSLLRRILRVVGL